MSTEHMHVTSSGVFNNNSDFSLNNSDFPLNSRKKKKKKSRVIAFVHSCVFRVELDESQCLYTATGNFVCFSMLRIVG